MASATAEIAYAEERERHYRGQLQHAKEMRDRTVYWNQVLIGKHSERDYFAEPARQPDGTLVYPVRLYQAAPPGQENSWQWDIFRSPTDLHKKLDPPHESNMTPKFRTLSEEMAQQILHDRERNRPATQADITAAQVQHQLSRPEPVTQIINPGESMPNMPTANPGNVVPQATNAVRAAPTTGDMEKMNVQQLQQLAADEEIDLKGNTSKASIIAIIRKAIGS